MNWVWYLVLIMLLLSVAFIYESSYSNRIAQDEGGCAEDLWALQTDLRSLLFSRMAFNQNRLQASCYACQGNPPCLHVQQSNIHKQIFGFNIHQKPFSKNLNMIIKFLILHKQFVLVYFYWDLNLLFCFPKFHKSLNWCRTWKAYHFTCALECHQFTKQNSFWEMLKFVLILYFIFQVYHINYHVLWIGGSLIRFVHYTPVK